jgi:hypothetical protein
VSEPAVRPYDPAHPCPMCGTEGGAAVYHAEPLLIVFGGAPQWACLRVLPRSAIAEHFCSKCEMCGFAWIESLPMTVRAERTISNKSHSGKEEEMAIRKHGTSDAQSVTGVEHAAISREAAASDEDLDGALAAENEQADSAAGDD